MGEQDISRAAMFRRRRKNAAGGARDARIVIVTTAEEDARLRARAAAQGVSVQRMLMTAVEEPGAAMGVAAEVSLEERRAAFYELTSFKDITGKIANNINQIARHANAEQFIPPNLAPTLEAVRRIDARLDEAFRRSYGRLGG